MQLQELIDYTRQRTGIVNNQAVSDPELIGFLNNAMGSLDTLLATQYEDYRLTKYFAQLGGGGTTGGIGTVIASPTNQIPTPSNFFKLRAVDYGSPGYWVTCYAFGLPERNRYNNPYTNLFVPWGNQTARRIRVMGDSIWVEPETVASGLYQVWYTPQYERLLNPTDVIPSIYTMQGWIEYAVAVAGQKVYTKLLLNPAGFVQEAAYYEDQVRNAAANRMSQGPKSMIDVRNLSDTSWPFSGAGWGV